MKIVEEFDTLQGEGKYLGVPSYFIRTMGCNLRCEWRNPDGTTTKCDTPYTSWYPETYKEFNIEKTLSQIPENIQHIVITGGEPMLQKDLGEVVHRLQDEGYHITIETNGTIYRKDLGDAFMSISPKTKSSTPKDVSTKEYRLHTAYNNFLSTTKALMNQYDYQIKFVYNEINDFFEINRIVEQLHILKDKVYIMPQGITDKQFKERQVNAFRFCLKEGYNYTPRLHIDIFGNLRGV